MARQRMVGPTVDALLGGCPNQLAQCRPVAVELDFVQDRTGSEAWSGHARLPSSGGITDVLVGGSIRRRGESCSECRTAPRVPRVSGAFLGLRLSCTDSDGVTVE